MSETIRLVHYSEEPLPPLNDRTRFLSRAAKPCGLWVSAIDCETNWREWCESEEYGLDYFRTETSIALRPDAAVLVIAGLVEFDAFQAEYVGFPSWIDEVSTANRSLYAQYAIDWQRVASKYDGIIIAPYQWARRYDSRWYSGWDCASGCIWNPRAIDIGESRAVCFRERVAA